MKGEKIAKDPIAMLAQLEAACRTCCWKVNWRRARSRTTREWVRSIRLEKEYIKGFKIKKVMPNGENGYVVGRLACASRSSNDNAPAGAPSAEEQKGDTLSETYTEVMQERMGAPMIYRHEDGMNYTRILDDLIVGSCLQTEGDVDALVEEGVSTVMCLQEDSDMDYFSLDIRPIRSRCHQVKVIDHVRHAIRDFDPYSLRRRLPGAVALVAQNAAKEGHGTTYIHCTAGLGRAPATALAYMWWTKGIPLEEAYDQLTALRPCKPRVDAIREATVDMLYGQDPVRVKISLRRRDTAKEVRVAGLDVGWGQSVPMVASSTYMPRLWLTRHLPPGTYQFKFIWVSLHVHSAMIVLY